VTRKKHKKINQLRIIGGKWRSRKLVFSDSPTLRPTTDQIRETLFNWLQTDIANANCLDLFAGSGALGMEALSRGANQVFFVDNNTKAIENIALNLKHFDSTHGICQLMSADHFLQLESPTRYFDIVFVDPPFGIYDLAEWITKIEISTMLKSGALLYIESDSKVAFSKLNSNWKVSKTKKTGQVFYALLEYSI